MARYIAKCSGDQLEALIINPGVDEGLSFAGYPLAAQVRETVAAEMFRRRGLACLDWITDSISDAVAITLAREVAKTNPDFAIQKLKGMGRYVGIVPNMIQSAVINRAAMRSAPELIELLKDNKFSVQAVTNFAPDFNFTEYINDMNGAGKVTNSAWKFLAAKDPDQTRSLLIEGLGGSSGNGFSAAVEGMAIINGETEAAKWYVSMLDEIPETTRKESLRMLALSDASPRLEAVFNGLQSEQDRAEFGANLLNNYRTKTEWLLDESVEVRGKIIEHWMKNTMARTKGPLNAKELINTMDKLNFPEESREKLLSLLPPTSN
ncbi:hypothetical protein JIN85_11300 [Luteolibacter pohnpeiensis]|uniref:Uncharacterized protein n=1 Tax=Luteolibacter pohnpeiensis TaxID=454153 RepID=A0A934S811_9BACT|nr:hypothetical protein [Luteolibacter pohnpeiensis]MBK1883005.1 hypothetical protein [Luteolibacter pohnpeiensis]